MIHTCIEHLIYLYFIISIFSNYELIHIFAITSVNQKISVYIFLFDNFNFLIS
jgi:hypothetical protein